MKWAYYNEWEPYCAQWLRNLIDAGHIPAGDVDERDIREVSGNDLKGYGQCHFFAGIGGWAYAGRLAGIPDTEPVWTGSCPCQPFSSAGQAKGLGDERHLWPAFHRLIAECHPARIFGEQVASKDGRYWLAGVRTDLEALGYAVGAADLPAASVKAKHGRARLFWMGYAPGIIGDGLPDNGCCRGERVQEWKFGRNDCFQTWEGSDWDMDESPVPVLAYEVSGLLGATTAYGNAIVPQVAAEFMMAARAA